MCPKYRKIVFLNSQLATLAKLLITIQPADTVSLLLALSLATIRLLCVLYIPATDTHRLLGNSFAISVSCTAGAILIFDRWVATSGSVLKSTEEFTSESAPGKCIFSYCYQICVPGKRKQSNRIKSRIVSFSTMFITH